MSRAEGEPERGSKRYPNVPQKVFCEFLDEVVRCHSFEFLGERRVECIVKDVQRMRVDLVTAAQWEHEEGLCFRYARRLVFGGLNGHEQSLTSLASVVELLLPVCSGCVLSPCTWNL